jgi:hypothetical protein
MGKNVSGEHGRIVNTHKPLELQREQSGKEEYYPEQLTHH